MRINAANEMVSEGDPITADKIGQQKDTVLVTGSKGLIGRALCERLATSYNVAGFDHAQGPSPGADIEQIDADISSDSELRHALQTLSDKFGPRIASVIHLASYYDFSGRPSPLYDQVTVQGTARLLRFLRKFQVEQFIFASTMLVHSPARFGQRINEDWPLGPKWDYPISKVKTENLIQQEHGHTPTVLLRIAGVYDDHCHSIILANQIQRIYERKLTSHLFPGDLYHGQSFIHLIDLVQLFTQLISRRKQLPHECALLAGEPQTLGYDTLQREFAKLIHNEEWHTYQIPKNLAKFGAWLQNNLSGGRAFIKPWMIDLADDYYQLDISKAKRWAHWEPRHSLHHTLPLMVAELKKDPYGWYRTNHLTPPQGIKKFETAEVPIKKLERRHLAVANSEHGLTGAGNRLSDR